MFILKGPIVSKKKRIQCNFFLKKNINAATKNLQSPGIHWNYLISLGTKEKKERKKWKRNTHNTYKIIHI